MAKKWMDGINGPAMDQFVADLRSGRFRQGRSVLRSDGKFCCLGVMTEGVKMDLGITDSARKDYYVLNDRLFIGLPPIEVLEHLGIPETHLLKVGDSEGNVKLVRHSDYEMEMPDIEPHLTWATALNDMHYRTFDEIADRFEETFMVEVDD